MATTKQNPAAAKGKNRSIADDLENAITTKTPIPITYGSQALSTITGLNYLPFFAGEDNLFRSLLEIRLTSSTHSSCISDKTFYSIGTGLKVKDQEFPVAFDKKINGKGKTLDDICKMAFDAIYQDGNTFIEIVRTVVGSSKFVQVFFNNNMDCRLEAKADGSEPTHVLRSREFRRDGYFNWSKTEKPVRIPLWTDDPVNKTNVWKRTGDTERTVIHLKNEFAGIDYYGLPSNFPGFINAVLEYKCARFNGDNFDNNMFVGGILFVEGSMTPEEEKILVKKVRQQQTGDGKQMRVQVMAAEGAIQNTKFVPFTEKHDGHFIEFDQHNESKIIGANGWSRALLDMHQGSGIGKGGEYLKALFKMKYQTSILPVQTNVLNNFVFPLMQIIDEFKGTKFKDLPWLFEPVIPISLESLLDVNSLLTVDEGRHEMGREPLGGEQGGKLISEVKKPEPAPIDNTADKAEKVEK